jgi:hypothetical protein
MTPRQLIHEPEASVVTRACVFGTWIAESDDEFECVPGHLELAGTRKNRGATMDRRAA